MQLICQLNKQLSSPCHPRMAAQETFSLNSLVYKHTLHLLVLFAQIIRLENVYVQQVMFVNVATVAQIHKVACEMPG